METEILLGGFVLLSILHIYLWYRLENREAQVFGLALEMRRLRRKVADLTDPVGHGRQSDA